MPCQPTWERNLVEEMQQAEELGDFIYVPPKEDKEEEEEFTDAAQVSGGDGWGGGGGLAACVGTYWRGKI